MYIDVKECESRCYFALGLLVYINKEVVDIFPCFKLISLHWGGIFVENKIGRYEQGYYSWKWF